jgi:cation transport protein ChaC
MTLHRPDPRPQAPDPIPDAQDFWVFGYGSLVWRPGFAYAERRSATIHGYHRALCVLSHVHRGTPERPGLVLGLDRGGSCQGLAFRVADGLRAATLAYLREREQVTAVYHELVRPVRLDDGRLVRAVTYAVDRQHGQYSGPLTPDEVISLVRQGVGRSGANPEYIINTYEHLLQMGIRDRALERIALALEPA